jgi:hypothetical protein
MTRFLPWLGIGTSKFYDWKARFGKVNEHNAWVPRDPWLTEPEKDSIKTFARQHPLEGYRHLTFMMLDAKPSTNGSSVSPMSLLVPPSTSSPSAPPSPSPMSSACSASSP